MSRIKLYWSDGTTNTARDAQHVVDLLLDQTLINLDEGTRVSLIRTDEVE